MGVQSALYDGLGGVIAAHGVYDDLHARTLLLYLLDNIQRPLRQLRILVALAADTVVQRRHDAKLMFIG